MSEKSKSPNRLVLERIAREIFHFEDEDRIDAFVNEFIYACMFY